MTWRTLWHRLKDPTIVFALVLAICGQLQASSDALLSWLGPEAAGHVLTLIGVIAAALRILQTLPPDDPRTPLEHAAADHDGLDRSE
jgi:hypothetical protein